MSLRNGSMAYPPGQILEERVTVVVGFVLKANAVSRGIVRRQSLPGGALRLRQQHRWTESFGGKLWALAVVIVRT
jgi:hypothetical protein